MPSDEESTPSTPPPATVDAEAEAEARADEAEAEEAEAQVAAAEPTTPREAEPPPDTDAPWLVVRLGGEYELRGAAMNDIPLAPIFPSGARSTSRSLGQNAWLEQWFRLRGEAGLRPFARIVGQIDLVRGLVLGDRATGVYGAERPRDSYDAFESRGLAPRTLFVEWDSPIGAVRAGAMAEHWGLGMVANDGDHVPVFGDYRFGDLLGRVQVVPALLGKSKPLFLSLAGDYVLHDSLAQASRGDRAYRGTAQLYYQRGTRFLGLYGAYRVQDSANGDSSKQATLDVYARWDAADPSGGRLYAAVEAAYVFGTSELATALERGSYDVAQWLAVAQVGRHTDHLDLVIEGGFASGDADARDGTLRRGVMDPDRHVGLILFPEVLAWQSARMASLARDASTGRPYPSGTSALSATNGGVAGAFYLFPHAIWRPKSWLEVRLGAVLARATSDVVDPYAQRARGQTTNHLGGDPTHRDLGLEVDGSVMLRTELAHGVSLGFGVEGGALFSGRALDDAMGARMADVGLVRLRGSLRW